MEISKNNIIHILKQLYESKFIRFFFVGGIAALTDILFLFVLTEYGKIYYIYSATLSFIIVTLSAFFVHKYFTFRGNSGSGIKQVVLFFLINIFGLGLYVVLLKAGVNSLKMYYLYVAIVSKFIVFIWNFLANKFITFS